MDDYCPDCAFREVNCPICKGESTPKNKCKNKKCILGLISILVKACHRHRQSTAA